MRKRIADRWSRAIPRTHRVPCFLLSVAIAGLFSGCGSPSTKVSSEKPGEPSQTTTVSNAAPATGEQWKQAAALPSAPFEGTGWQCLFDGTSLKGWRETAFAGRGEVACESGLLVFNMGDPFTGVNWTNDFPKVNYEVALDAMRVMGSDFFCGLTVPVGTNYCSLIVGGWGGSLVGISSLDDMDASENETTKYINFEQGHWYRVRLRVTENRLEAWIDRDKLVNVVTTGRKISLRPGDIELSAPFGIASWTTTAALRNLRWRTVEGPEGPPKRND